MSPDSEIVIELREKEVRFGYSDQMVPMGAISMRVDFCLQSLSLGRERIISPKSSNQS